MRGFIELLNSKFAIEPTHGRQLAAIAHLVMEKKLPLSKEIFGVKSEDDRSSYTIDPQDESGKVVGRLGVVSINGPMFRNDQWCGPEGMLTMANKIKGFDQDPEIDAILIDMYTPGGQVDGGETLANAISSTEKPTLTFAEMMCSMGMHVAAGSDMIILSGKNACAGSIGTRLSYWDFTKKFEEEGIQYVDIVATSSPDKNEFNFDDPSKEDQKKIANRLLDPLHANFMDHLKAHRPQIPEEAMTGKVYYAKEAISLGLADSIGSFEDAIYMALEMAGKIDEHSTETGTQMSAETKPVATTSEEGQEPKTIDQVSQDHIKKLEGMVVSKNKAIITHLESIDALKLELEEVRKENEELKKEKETLQAKVDELSGEPADEARQLATAENDPQAGPTTPPKELTAFEKKQQEYIEAGRKMARRKRK